MYEVIQTGMMIILSAIAVWDILYRKFSAWVLWMILLLAIGCKVYLGDVCLADALAGAAVGAGFVLISKVTDEALGYADSLLIAALGIFLGIWDLFLLLVMAFSLAAVFAVVGMFLKKLKKDFSIPFIPFLAVSYAGVMMIG